MLLQQLRHSENRADTHFIGLTSCHRDPTVSTQWSEAQLFCGSCFHHHLRRRAIRQLRRITRRNRAAFDHGSQTLNTFKRRRTNTFVSAHCRLSRRLLSCFLVINDALTSHGDQLVFKLARLVSRRRALLRLQAILIHGIPAHVVSRRDHLSGLQHRHIDVFVHG